MTYYWLHQACKLIYTLQCKLEWSWSNMTWMLKQDQCLLIPLCVLSCSAEQLSRPQNSYARLSLSVQCNVFFCSYQERLFMNKPVTIQAEEVICDAHIDTHTAIPSLVCLSNVYCLTPWALHVFFEEDFQAGASSVVWKTSQPYEAVIHCTASRCRVVGLNIDHASPSVANNYAVLNQVLTLLGLGVCTYSEDAHHIYILSLMRPFSCLRALPNALNSMQDQL